MEIKSKTERIQIIVKAAVHHLNISGLTWEEVRNSQCSGKPGTKMGWIILIMILLMQWNSQWARINIYIYQIKSNQITSNHFYCHITTAQVPW